MSITVSLNDNWKMKKAGSQESFDCKVPCSVYKTLLDYKKIPDPYYRENEYISTQICDDDYDFETTFTADKTAVECEHTVLHFDGIDTIANVCLNGIHLGRVNNMHRVWEFPVHGIIKEGDNTLTVKITSPNRYIKEMDEKRHLWGVDSTMTGYTHIRKAHCMFGWDWGPMLPDMGIWRSVSLIVPDAGRILDVYYSQKHTDNKVTLKALLHIENHGCKKAMVEISDPQGNITAKADISLEGSAEYYETELVISDPQLWWVNGYGEQPLYSCAVTLYDENDACTDKNTQRIGLRTLTVSREKDQWGEEFCFINNGVKIFAMGANYIPEDQIVTRCNEEKTRKLLADCKAANYNFIRVWGGGYYPDEYFYDYCDENGIIVWQDFMFACSAYLLTEEFEETVRGEVRDNVIRLRNHPSLGLWCGNNEMTQAWYNWGWSRNRTRTPEQRAEIWEGYRRIFFEMLPGLVAEHDPQRFYWPSSPSSEPHEPQNYTSGDVHYWKYRTGRLPVSVFRTEMGRFMSEWGFNSAPTMPTIESYTEPGDRDMASPVFRGHVKSHFEPELSQYYVGKYYNGREDFSSQVFLGQVHQAEAMKFVIEQHRINRPFCMGTLYWQLNDCWPGNSWSTIDYYGRRKPAHYSVRRAYAPVLVAADLTADSLRVFLVNDPVTPIEGATLVARLLSFTGEELSRTERAVEVAGASSEPVWEESLPRVLAGHPAERVVLSLRVVRQGRTIASNEVLFTDVKQLELPEPRIVVEQRRDGDDLLLNVTSSCYAKYVTLGLPDGCVPSDDCFDLLPGETHVVRVAQAPDGVTCHLSNYLDFKK